MRTTTTTTTTTTSTATTTATTTTAGALLATAALAAAALVGAQPAAAAGPVVTVTGRATNQANFNNPIGTCNATPGLSCTIAKTTTATRTVDVALGVSRSVITAGLSISNATSQSVTVSCSYTMTSKYKRLVAYPVGTQIFYKVTANGKTSGTLMAFDPRGGNAMECYPYR